MKRLTSMTGPRGAVHIKNGCKQEAETTKEHKQKINSKNINYKNGPANN